MKTATIFLFALSMASILWSDAYKDEIIRLSGLVQGKNYQGAIDGYKKLLQNPGLTQWQTSAAYADLAYLDFTLKQADAGFAAYEHAVQLGYDDFIIVHEIPIFRPYFSDPRFKATYAKMKISQADMTELYWLKGEIQSAIHDMNMMIQENMGRKDDSFTEVPQQQIPTRKTGSVGVMTNRLVLDIIQGMQRNNVRESDVSRINHLIQMGIISRMPGGDGSNEDDSRQVLESRRQADERAQQRRQAIAGRRFSLPGGASTVLQPCPALGSLKTQ